MGFTSEPVLLEASNMPFRDLPKFRTPWHNEEHVRPEPFSEKPIMKLRLSFAFYALVAIALILSPSESRAANHYILPSGTGNSSGSDWNNACNQFTGSCAPSSLVRGDTYYIGGGSYTGGYDFNTATSGTSAITVKGATASDHGTATGWNSSFGVDVTQATFGFGSTCSGGYPGCMAIGVDSSYWVFDGQVGDCVASMSASHTCAGKTSYGFSADATGQTAQQHIFGIGFYCGCTITNVTFRHMAATGAGSGPDVSEFGFAAGTAANAQNINLQYLFTDQFETAIGVGYVSGSTTWLIERDYLAHPWSSASNHGIPIVAFNSTAVTFRYNWFTDCGVDVGCFASNGVANENSIDNWDIYGNVIEACTGTGGIVGVTGNHIITNTRFYNNTVLNCTAPIIQQDEAGAGPNYGHGNATRNNILYNSNCSVVQGAGTAIDDDYDSMLSCSSGTLSETHGQVVRLNPFVNSSSNYHLTADAVASCASTSATCTGATVDSSPYAPANQTDMDGLTRGADGTWERGAYEYIAGDPPVDPPTGLTAVVN